MIWESISDSVNNDPALEEALTDDTLSAWFPVLQSSVKISTAGADRLKRAITLGKAPIGTYQYLGIGWSSETISGDDLRAIILSLAEQESGYPVATDILSMRFYSKPDEKKEYPFELIDAGRKLLAEPVFKDRDNMLDYHLHSIANVCLVGTEGTTAARSLCERIRQGFADHSFQTYNYEQLLKSIFRLQPEIALDVFFGDALQIAGDDLEVDDFDSPSDRRKNPLDGVPIDKMLLWCDAKPRERYPAISRAVSYYTASKDGKLEWTPLAIEMLSRAPDHIAILETFVGRFSPGSWSGSRATIIETRLGLLDQLGQFKNVFPVGDITRIRSQLVESIEQERKLENERDSSRDERFE